MTSIALHVGLNSVDPDHYAGWNGTLAGCENDARDMAAITRTAGFTVALALTREATATRVLDFLDEAASTLRAGDHLCLTFSGHGGQVPATDLGEVDKLDETWALYDRMVVDNEIRAALGRLRPGVSALVILDCCHSGTAVRLAERAGSPQQLRIRAVPEDVTRRTVSQSLSLYKAVRSAAARTPPSSNEGPSAILLAACQDDQVAADGDDNGLFTGTLKRVWDGGRFEGDYRRLLDATKQLMPRHQVPNLDSFGPGVQRFIQERPFSASSSASQQQETNIIMANDINDNWGEVAAALGKLKAGSCRDGDLLSRAIAGNAQAAQTAYFGTAASPSKEQSRSAVRGGTVARAFWWGFHIEVSHDDLQVFLSSADPINAVIGALGGGIPSPAAPFIALSAAFVAGALGALRGLDRGRGVYVSMSWFAPGIFIPSTVPTGREILGNRGPGDPYEQAGDPWRRDYNGGPFGLRLEEDIYWNLPDGTVRESVIVLQNPPNAGNIRFTQWLSEDPTVGHFRLHVGLPWWQGVRIELRMMIRDSAGRRSATVRELGPRQLTAKEL